MRVMNRADNTSDKNPTTMAVKNISIYFENDVGVVENVKGDEGFGDHEISGVANTTEQLQMTFGYVQRARGSVETRKIHTLMSSTQCTELLKTARSKEVAGHSGPDTDRHSRQR